MYFSIFNLIFFLTIINQSITDEWNYGAQGPDVWADQYPLCSGHSQSPIDIRTACTVYRRFEPFKFSSTYNQPQNFILINNGHTISGVLTDGNSSLLTLTGGGLDGIYKFSSFHFHWGENYGSGSEHQV
jgi:carbonic anhydrase